ncbi:MAG: hypothetical protein J6B04_06505 [Clostridia bacterium]|nr:hypothetical protein [Clostridia bacterium]
MKKQPWGVYAGIIAMIWSLVTIGLIAISVVSGMMITEVGTDDGLSTGWWMIPLYILEAVTVVTFAVSVIFYVIKERENKKLRRSKNENI